MIRSAWVLAALAAVTAAAAAAVSAAPIAADVRLTPIERLPFPARGFVVDLPPGARVAPTAIQVQENGHPVRHLDIAPIREAGVHYGVLLAIDASESMTGEPLTAAVAAARKFSSRLEPGEQVGVLAFNDKVRTVQQPTDVPAALSKALSTAPPIAYGTRLYDAADQALAVLAKKRLSTSSIVLLSDGADIGSSATLDDVVAKARNQHVRVFTVGLQSGAFQFGPLRRLAEGTGGTYAETTSAAGLAAIFDGIRQRIASGYVIRYTSDAAPKSDVTTTVTIRDIGTATKRYTAPTPAGLQPFHRSLFSRFVLSPLAIGVLGLLVALLVALVIWSFSRPRTNSVVSRVDAFSGSPKSARVEEAARMARAIAQRPRQSVWFAKLESRLEIARVDISATKLVLLTLGGTVVATVVLGLISPVFALIGLMTPVITRSWVSRQLKKVREEFADQLPPNLQVLASALRIGHSFVGALTVVVENAHEPSHSELQRVVADERLGVPLEDAIQRVAVRMDSRDLEQVALLAQLQRTAGGNSAEVLDTVIETLRERADIRRLVKTLTAQGRMARWILTALPVGVGLFMFFGRNELMRPLLESGGGQVAIVIATTMVVAGSLVIQRIVDIKV